MLWEAWCEILEALFLFEKVLSNSAFSHVLIRRWVNVKLVLQSKVMLLSLMTATGDEGLHHWRLEKEVLVVVRERELLRWEHQVSLVTRITLEVIETGCN